MAFITCFSNRVEALSEQLMACMDIALVDPLAPDHVLVDNLVMGQWLNLQIAQKNSIAANINYIQPHELFWTLARAVLPQDIPRPTPLSKQEMTWKLYRLFGDGVVLAKACMQPVRHYLEGDDCRDLKRFQLAVAVADLYDQYLVYRPEMLLAWERPGEYSSNEAWQRELWLAIAKGIDHRAAIEQQLLAALDQAVSADIRKIIPLQRLFVFGITSMAPHLVRMLMLLGKHIDVQLFALNPCREYWGLIQGARDLARKKAVQLQDMYYEIGNPLLASQGVQLRDFIHLLQEYSPQQEEAFSDTAVSHTLLESIQQEIRDLTYKGKVADVDYVADGDKQPLPEADGNRPGVIPSVHIHQCHSVMREVEVLHDQLRDMLRQNPDMNPRDIVVMMPRVTDYVPCIHAVFNGVAEQHRIPYHITDRTQVEESPLLNSFTALLALPVSRLPLSEVIGLLEVPAIQRRFGIDQAGYETLKRWLVDAGVRWGVDAKHRAAEGLPAYSEASWEFAFDRLLSGYAMAADKSSAASIVSLSDEIMVLPYDEVEGGNSGHLDAFLQFWDAVLRWRNRLLQPDSPQAWAERLRDLVEDFFLAEDESEIQAINAIYSAIRDLDSVVEQQWYVGDIALPVIRDMMQPALEQRVSGRHQWREGIKFCSLMPMRGVPFKVVYIMGMNLEDYPRRIERLSFDLMRHQHRAGDRASRIDDRWLFLEALLSARRYFHVSYIGKDMHRNEKREPSVVLSELLDYCRHGYDLPADYLVTSHPLQPFSEAYFRQDKTGLSQRLVSFSEEALRIAQARQLQAAEPVDGDSRWAVREASEYGEPLTVRVEHFIQFFTKPWEWFFTRKHKVWLEIEDSGVDDAENFGDAEDGTLQDWHCYNDLIQMANAMPSAPENREAARDVLVDQLISMRKAEGRWPLGDSGEKKRDTFKELDPDYLWASCGMGIAPVQASIRIGSGQHVLLVEGDWALTSEGVFMRHSASNLGKEKNYSDKAFSFDMHMALAKQFSDVQQAGANKKKPQEKNDTQDVKRSLSVSEGVAHFRDRTRRYLLSDIDGEQNKKLLDTLAQLYCRYQEVGLPMDYSAGDALTGLEDEDERGEWISEHWSEHIASDSKKRTYFGQINVLQGELFNKTTEEFWAAIQAWRDPVEQQISLRKDAEKAQKKASKGKAS